MGAVKEKETILWNWGPNWETFVETISGINLWKHVTNTIFSFRYNTILPYDENRVNLIAEIDGSDYINASWITDKMEIATQGPLPNTVVHFLQMICEQKIDIIVMLTKTVEENVNMNVRY